MSLNLKNVSQISLILVAVFLTTACTKWTALPHDPSRLKETNGSSWGKPELRPVVWGYTGIPVDCEKQGQKDCKIQK